MPKTNGNIIYIAETDTLAIHRRKNSGELPPYATTLDEPHLPACPVGKSMVVITTDQLKKIVRDSLNNVTSDRILTDSNLPEIGRPFIVTLPNSCVPHDCVHVRTSDNKIIDIEDGFSRTYFFKELKGGLITYIDFPDGYLEPLIQRRIEEAKNE